MKPFRLHMDLFEAETRTYTLNTILDAVGNAIGESREAIVQAEASGPPEYSDDVADDESDMVEALLGVAFVACQVNITRVVSRVTAIHRLACRIGNPLTTTSGKKPDIMVFGSQLVGEGPYTQVEVIDAFANYFKHRDEWPYAWSGLEGRRDKVVQVIQSVGAEQSCSGNLRTGAEALGNTAYCDLGIFSRVISCWGTAVCHGYREELTSRNLL